jgi:flagellar motor switch protein FliG
VTADEVKDRATKAAIILLAMGGSLGSRVLKDMAPEAIKSFAANASAVSDVDPHMLERLVGEFSSEMEKPLALKGGGENARAVLAGVLAPEAVDEVFGRKADVFVPVWDKFAAGAENTLVPYLLDQHPQVAACVVTQLEPALAARVVSTLPRELRESVARRLLKMQPVSELVSRTLQDSLRRDLLADADTGLEKEGRIRMAALLNRMEKADADAMLESLKKDRPEEAAALRKLLFSFEDIPRLEQKYRLILFDKVQTEQVMYALRGAESDLKEIILSSLGARARRMIESELSSASTEVTKDVIAARQAVAAMALQLAGTGDIVITDPDVPQADAAA